MSLPAAGPRRAGVVRQLKPVVRLYPSACGTHQDLCRAFLVATECIICEPPQCLPHSEDTLFFSRACRGHCVVICERFRESCQSVRQHPLCSQHGLVQSEFADAFFGGTGICRSRSDYCIRFYHRTNDAVLCCLFFFFFFAEGMRQLLILVSFSFFFDQSAYICCVLGI